MTKMVLTIQNINERDWHDKDAHQHVCHSQRAQEEICCILQLLLQRHSQDDQNVPSYCQQDDHQYEQCWPVLLFDHLSCYSLSRG